MQYIKESQLHSQRITSISIHHLTIIQRLHPSYMTLEQVAEMKPAYKKQKGHRTLFSHHGLHLSLQATKLLASLTYPLKITKSVHPAFPTCPPPTPHQHPTLRRAQRVLQALRPTPEATA
jgi:hypothetical protein